MQLAPTVRHSLLVPPVGIPDDAAQRNSGRRESSVHAMSLRPLAPLALEPVVEAGAATLRPWAPARLPGWTLSPAATRHLAAAPPMLCRRGAPLHGVLAGGTARPSSLLR